MIVKIPKEIVIGSHTYKVWFDEREDDSDFRGSTLHRRHEIILNPNLHSQQLRTTFLHEAVHVLTEVYQQKMPEDAVAVLGEALGELLFRVLRIDFDFSDVPVRKVEGRE